MIVHSWRILWALCFFEAQRLAAFPWEFAVSMVARLLNTVIYATFWLLVARYSTGIDIEPREIISYYLIVSAVVPWLSSNYGIASELIKSIKTGSLSQVLIKPVHPILYPWAVRFGRNLASMLFGVVLMIVGIVMANSFAISTVPLLLLALVNAVLINVALNALLGCIGFYLAEGSGLKNAMIHISRLSRGELIPLYLMPSGLAAALSLTPFPAAQYHLVLLLQGIRTPSVTEVILGSMWALLLLVAAQLLWRKSIRLYEATGL